MKKAVVLLLLLVGVGLFVWKNMKGNVEEDSQSEPLPAETMKGEWWEQAGVRVATLTDVAGGDSSGVGYVSRDSDGLKHRVVATLPILEEGESFYEGWLVRKSPTLEFFSTGEMKLVGSEYRLDYTSENIWEGYDEVVITLENKRDEIPEKHIIEGVLGEEAMGTSYSLDEVAEHDNRDDCWLAIEGKVYDVTSFVGGGLHPGGLIILQGCGKDATAMFNLRPGKETPHSEKARQMLPKYEIGVVAN